MAIIDFQLIIRCATAAEHEDLVAFLDSIAGHLTALGAQRTDVADEKQATILFSQPWPVPTPV